MKTPEQIANEITENFVRDWTLEWREQIGPMIAQAISQDREAVREVCLNIVRNKVELAGANLMGGKDRYYYEGVAACASVVFGEIRALDLNGETRCKCGVHGKDCFVCFPSGKKEG